MKKLLLIYLLFFAFSLSAQNGNKTMYVLKPCNMYSKASSKSDPVHLLNYYKKLSIKPAANGWVYVEHYDRDGIRHTGYVQKANLTTNKDQAYEALQKSMAE